MTLGHIDGFAGAGGAAQGFTHAGIPGVGIETSRDACATAQAAGHTMIRADITTLDPTQVQARMRAVTGTTRTILHMSPPCQGFSLAGLGTGRDDIDPMLALIRAGHTTPEAVTAAMTQFRADAQDPRSVLTLEILRWVTEIRPAYVSLEQVPSVLPLWEAIGYWLTTLGYHVWTGTVRAEMFGVPQTRVRAVLLASADHPVSAPSPTHSRYHERNPGRLDPDRLDSPVLPWVSMAEALGWGATGRPSYTVTGGGTESGGAEVFARGARDGMAALRSNYSTGGDASTRGLRLADQPASTVTTKNMQWVEREMVDREVIEGHNTGQDWPAHRPATTVVASYRPDVIAAPGYRGPGDGPRQDAPGSVTVTPVEAGVLQSFPADYPWHGKRTSQYRQVGNAYPPVLAAAMFTHLTHR